MTGNSDRVRAYLRGELSSEEVTQFEYDVKESEGLTEELTRQLLQQKGRLDLKTKLGELETQRKRRRGLRRNAIWSAAASLIFLAGFFIWYSAENLSTQDLYVAYFEPAAPIGVNRDTDINDSSRSQLEKAMLPYANKEYAKAKKLFQQVDESSKAEIAQFYIAMCYLAEVEPNHISSMELLSAVINLDGPYQQQAYWYRGLVYLHISQVEKAREDFEALVLSGGYKSAESKEILKQL